MSKNKDFLITLSQTLNTLSTFDQCVNALIQCVAHLTHAQNIYVLERQRAIFEVAHQLKNEAICYHLNKLDINDAYVYPISLLNTLFDYSDKNTMTASKKLELLFQHENNLHVESFEFITVNTNSNDKNILVIIDSPGKTISQSDLPFFTLFLNQVSAEIQKYMVEKTALTQQYQGDIRQGNLIEDIRKTADFLTYLEKLNESAITLARCKSLDQLYFAAVENARVEFNFDRIALFLVDMKRNLITGTYGTNIEGEVVNESYYSGAMPSHEYILKALAEPGKLHVNDNAPLFHNDQVVGLGWNALVTLANDDNEVIAWFAMDNLINHKKINDYQIKVIEHFSRYLAQQIIHKREDEDVRLLHQALSHLSNAETTLDICKLAVEITRDSLGIDRLGLFLVELDTHKMQGTYGTNERGETTDERYFRSDIPDSEFIKNAIYVRDYFYLKENVPLYHDKRIVGYGWNATIALWDGDTPVGWIAADNLINRRPMSSHQERIIKLFASSVAQLISKRRAQDEIIELNKTLEAKVIKRTLELKKINTDLKSANGQLERLSSIDALTQLANRRTFDLAYAKDWAHAQRNGFELTVLMIDIDYFKLLNDHHGHGYGDDCLQIVAQCIAAAAKRINDTVARYGGEEFIISIPICAQKEALKMADNIHKNIAEARLVHGASPLSELLTLSIGICTVIPDESMDSKQLLMWADKALYQAKHSGRNQSGIYDVATK